MRPDQPNTGNGRAQSKPTNADPTRHVPSLPDGFVWIQPDALRVRCTDCGDEVSADVLDLHICAEGGGA